MPANRGLHTLTRRRFCYGVASSFGCGCASVGCQATSDGSVVEASSITARPASQKTSLSAGTRELRLGGARDGLIRVPDVGGHLPLVVLLHGASGRSASFLESLASVIDFLPAVILAPDSAGRTWDALSTEPQTLLDMVSARRRFAGFGQDVRFLNNALEYVFANVAVDPERIAIGGFSDGATYALSLGLMNGDLVKKVVAFSPGFTLDGLRRGRPAVFISHGRADRILPIDRCSRRIVRELKGEYDVTYREFEGGHRVPEDIAREALAWAVR